MPRKAASLEVQVLFAIWVVFHVIVCLALIAVVLMQSAKGEGLAGTSFGGGMSNAVFGGRGAAGFLSKATTILAVVFFVNCGALALMSANQSGVVGTTADPSDSPITRQAQAERERAIQQQQAAQQRQADTVNSGTIQVDPPTPPPGTDQSGDGGGN